MPGWPERKCCGFLLCGYEIVLWLNGRIPFIMPAMQICPPTHPFSWLDTLLRILAVALLYAALSLLSLKYLSLPTTAPMVWPPAGLALATLLLGGRRYAWSIFIASVGIATFRHQAWYMALAFATALAAEALIAHWWLTEKRPFSLRLARKRDFIWLLQAELLGSGLCALFSSWVQLQAGWFDVSQFWSHALHWLQSEALGISLFTPLILLWRHWPPQVPERRYLEAGLCLLLCLLSGQMAFLGHGPEALTAYAKDYWIFLYVAWAAIRLGKAILSLLLVMVATQALLGAVQGLGYFAFEAHQASLGNFWLFVLMLMAIGYALNNLITVANQNNRQLIAERSFTTDVINSLPGAFFVVDEALQLVRWNTYLRTVSGCTDDELHGVAVFNFVLPEDQPLLFAQVQQVMSEGSAQAEARLVDKQGEITPYRISARRTVIDGLTYIVGMCEDISDRQRAEDALRISEQKYRTLFENINANITLLDAEGCVLMMNECNARMMGGKPADFIGKFLRELDPEHAESFLARYRDILQTGQGGIFEDPFPTPQGTRWFASRVAPIADDEGQWSSLQVIAFDITERKGLEESLQRSEELWKFALEGAGDSVWDWDIDRRQVSFSPRWKTQLGYDDEEEVGSWLSQVHPEDRHLTINSTRAILAGDESSQSIELRIRCKDGSYRWFLSRGMVVHRAPDGRALRVVGTNADISSSKEQQRQLEHLALFDALTGLPNRVQLAGRLKQAMAQSLRRNLTLAVAYLDLDGFKAVNDRYGHKVGDELLKITAQRMQAALREGDVLARIGGDEFIAVLTDLPQAMDCEPVLERLLRAAAEPTAIASLQLQLSASIGVTLYPLDGVEADQLVRHADQAMYQAKQSGKNRYHLFDIDRDAAMQQQHELISDIRRGLQEQEFELYYQPKVSMKTGALMGVEALIRWRHPQRGLCLPGEFLPVIETQPLSLELGQWVIDEALRQLEIWRSEGLDIPVSVNVSAYQLQQANFVACLEKVLALRPAIDPSRLELEILETSAVADVMEVSAIIRACQQLGVGFAIDDFGTGYSSLSYLKHLPAETLKIDQTFVRDMLDDPDDLAIVEGIVGLAQAFRRKVVAEGVETTAHGELLLQLGCELAQGYGIARPMPASELVGWAARWRPDANWLSWREQPLARADLPVLFAEVRHRQWLRTFDRLLDGEALEPPKVSHDACHFMAWLEGQGGRRYGHHLDYARVIVTHERLHGLSRSLLLAFSAGQQDEARAYQFELHQVYDELSALLHALIKPE